MTSQIRNPQSAIRNRQWWLVTLAVSPGHEEAASSLLFDLGSTGIVTLEESAHSVKLGAYFEEPLTAGEITQAVRAGLPDGLLSLFVTEVAEEDWLQKWKEGFEPVRIGERLVIAPSWKRSDTFDDRVVIQIDPGMAFGTGTHETTRLCLEAVERYWRGGSLLDVGTGTGILAIAAALLSPGSRVVAVDVDPQAVEVARENIAINGVSSSVELFEGDPGKFADGTFDAVIANLTAEVIAHLMSDLASCVAPDGLMILSGVLCEFADDTERSLFASRFKVIERCEAGEWCALIARRT